MKVSDVSESDCVALTDLLTNMRQCRVPTEFRLGDMSKMVDAVRWLQSVAVDMAKALAESKQRPAAPEPAAAVPEGFTIKEYNPGSPAPTPTPIKRPKK